VRPAGALTVTSTTPLASTTASLPASTSTGGASGLAAQAWLLDARLVNALPGPWDRQRLPLENLDVRGEWRGGVVIARHSQRSFYCFIRKRICRAHPRAY
jgi:hypothetical protein